MELSHKVTNRLIGLGVFIIAFATFYSTLAPTVSFWDCGEYIASSYSLGIPHPPGNPMYVLLGRIFTMIFFWTEQVALRVNLMSVFAGAGTAFMLYHIIVKALVGWIGKPEETWQKVTMYVPGVVGALFGVFNYTFWFSAVEASVYIPAVLTVAINVYIALVWAQSEEENRDRFLVLFAYVAFLGIGIHMMSMFALFPIFLYIVLVDPEKLKDWRLWGVALMLGSVMYSMAAFFFVVPPLLIFTGIQSYSKGSTTKIIAPIVTVLSLFVLFHLLAERGIELFPESLKNASADFSTQWLVLFLILVFSALSLIFESTKENTFVKWKLPFYIVLFATLGYSVHMYIPIRSALEPMIDENHPVVELSAGDKIWKSKEAFEKYAKANSSRMPLLLSYAQFKKNAKKSAPELYATLEERYARGYTINAEYSALLDVVLSDDAANASYTKFMDELSKDKVAQKLYKKYESTMGSVNRIQWDAFRGFLERKQYGTESMITRMVARRGAFGKQFGIDGHMGYGGFHLTQFFHFGESIYSHRRSQNDGEAAMEENTLLTGPLHQRVLYRLIYLIPTLFMFFGWYYWVTRKPKEGIFFTTLFLITTIALVLYMNFADGTRPNSRDDIIRWKSSVKQWDVQQSRLQLGEQMQQPRPEKPKVHREVRIRDYFFTAGFTFFGMWMGLALAALLHMLYTSDSKVIREKVAPAVAALMLLSPIIPFTQNYDEHYRVNDWIPYDYAYNLLMSCEQSGILFTNGDNDTFPLWFLQEAEGIRRDVRVVNLSLVNTKWYIKQLKRLEPKVPMNLSEIQIDAQLNHTRNPFTGQEIELEHAKIKITPPAANRKPVMQVQDYMIKEIVDANAWEKPIYFSVTVSDNNLMGLRPYLQQDGLVYRVMPDTVAQKDLMNFERSSYLLDKVYNFRNLGDGSTPLSETARKLMYNYSAAYLQYAFAMTERLVQAGDVISRGEEISYDSTMVEDEFVITETVTDIDSLKQWKETSVNDVKNKLDRAVGIVPWDIRTRAVRHGFMMQFGMEEEAKANLANAVLITDDIRQLRLPSYSSYRNPFYEIWNRDITLELQK